jgi:peptidoglycan/LPS O-acetylase OafA/YrhL
MGAMGNASYSIYLVQVLTIPVGFAALPTLGFGLDVTIGLVAGATLLVGQAIYVLVERPLLKALHRRARAAQ